MERGAGFVYLIVNRANKMAYVGITVQSIWKRFQAHRVPGCKAPISRAIRKYGPDNFDCCVLEVCQSHDILKSREIHWINEIGSMQPNGYNLTLGGGGLLGVRRTEEYKKRMSESRRGEANPNYGNHKPWTPHRKEDFMNRGVPHHMTRPEVKAKVGQGQARSWGSGNRANVEAQKQALRDQSRLNHSDPEIKARHLKRVKECWEKRRASGFVPYQTGIKLSEEQRQEISRRTKEAMARPEVKAKIEAALKLRKRNQS